ELVGSEHYAQAIVQLPSELRTELDALTAVSWLPLTSLAVVLDEVAKVSAREVEEMVDETVRRSIDRTFKTVWRMLLRVTSVEAMVKRTPMIYARSRNIGQLEARLVEPCHAEVILSGWSDVSERQLRVLAVSIQRVVELSARHDVQMTYVRTPQGGRYQLRWRE
ncbi:MAG TPA: hypothetical protein VHZ95_16425, partial [Polyangiales bacterium]|nr:hypothetical protein [Polyangiales bacterium]